MLISGINHRLAIIKKGRILVIGYLTKKNFLLVVKNF